MSVNMGIASFNKAFASFSITVPASLDENGLQKKQVPAAPTREGYSNKKETTISIIKDIFLANPLWINVFFISR